ncbi:ROK family protein [Aureibacillus halotolerans]|uniref:Putative NBD/HSP70 family sugar kinase n=1 Tax=Aureibacillus halotolerans TaxID=1508390 RepID=A0A4R6TXG3_9BACI|nr:ROK family protein [Aureibacillus halotolerans]TDQ37462.1 putative NBD/HSP70 family sugar kinase [Aureibacillus halotolerans]
MKTLQTGDQNLVKKINKSIVLDEVEKKGPISRAQISKNTNLNKATVSTMVAELIQSSLVHEIGPGQSSGGRKPVMLYFNHRAGFSIGIDLGVYHFLAVLTDLKGAILFEIKEELNNQNFDAVCDQLIAVIERLISKAPESPYGVIGIGIGVPGLISRDGVIRFAPNLNWTDEHMRPRLEQHFHLPVIIENEANAGCHGEHLYGVGQFSDNMVYASVGAGIGTGLILQGKLYTGVMGSAGEMGHMTIETNGKKCRCGNRGCWELYASETALLSHAKRSNLYATAPPTLSDIIDQLHNADPEILQTIQQIGIYLGIGLSSIIHTFNPELIVIGNRMAQLEKWLANPVAQTLVDRVSPKQLEGTKISYSTLNHHACALGSASFATAAFLSEHRVAVATV